MTIYEIAYNIILPIFIVIGLAAVVDYKVDVNPHAMSRLLVYLFTPALVFYSLANMDIQADEVLELIAAALVFSLAMTAVGYGIARRLNYTRFVESAFVLSVALNNAGNYGIPLNRIAFGTDGEARAILCFVASVLFINTFGVFIASRGSTSTRDALLNTFRVPLPFATALGLLVNATDFTLPGPLNDSLDLAGRAAIPSMLAVLGIQLSRTLQTSGIQKQLNSVLLASGLRLLLAPVIGVGIALIFGFSGITRQVFIVEMSTPTAVLGSVLAMEFGSDAEHITATILVTTLASIITLSVLLSLLM